MKKLLFILMAVLLTTATMLSPSCTKPKGCTDPDAKNYDTSAGKDDGSCTYEGKVIFWYGESTSIALLNDRVNSLTYHIDGIIVGSTAASVYWLGSTGPECGQEGLVTHTKNLGSDKNKSYSFSVKSETGEEYWNGSISFSAKTCTTMELSWASKMNTEK